MSAAVLVLAGRDPTRGAGVDADLEALLAAGASGHALVTNETQQDGRRVQRVDPVPVAVWSAAARAAFGPDTRVVKTGLLSSAEQIDAVLELVSAWRRERPDLIVVVDPVLAASGGEVFLDERGRARLLACLGGLAPILTPNVPELAALTARPFEELAAEPSAREVAARTLIERGARAVCAKGGHGCEEPLVDLVVEADRITRLVRERHVGRRLHGSGCRYASFLAGALALGADLPSAAQAAGAWLGRLVAATDR